MSTTSLNPEAFSFEAPFVDNPGVGVSSQLSAIAHDLRSPLTSIVGYLELLQSGAGGPLSNQQSSMIDVVERNARTILQLSENLLNPGAPFEAKPIVAWDLFRDLSMSLVPYATSCGVSVDIDIDENLTTIAGDAVGLERVLVNVISNAIKFSMPGSRVKVTATSVLGLTRIAVKDSGVGIPAADLDNIFEPYVRASNAQATDGTGLGLAISREVVEQHGGAITVASELGKGTTVTVALPNRAPSEQ